MINKSSKVVFRVLLATLGLGGAGCLSGGDQEGAFEESGPASEHEDTASEHEDTDQAQSAYTASTACTVQGGGTWGAILRLCVSISASGTGTFIVTKADGTNFQTAGTMFLKVGTYETWGVTHATNTINGGGILPEVQFSPERFGQWPNYPKKYYARWESQPGGYAWVGPITIYQ